MRERMKTIMLVVSLAFVAWLLVDVLTDRGQSGPLVTVEVPLVHNLLREPLDSMAIASLVLYAVPSGPFADSLSSACRAFGNETAGFGSGPQWAQRWRQATSDLARRVNPVRDALATDSSQLSRGGRAKILFPTRSWLILASPSGSVGRVFYGDPRYERVQLAPLDALCAF